MMRAVQNCRMCIFYMDFIFIDFHVCKLYYDKINEIEINLQSTYTLSHPENDRDVCLLLSFCIKDVLRIKLGDISPESFIFPCEVLSYSRYDQYVIRCTLPTNLIALRYKYTKQLFCNLQQRCLVYHKIGTNNIFMLLSTVNGY